MHTNITFCSAEMKTASKINAGTLLLKFFLQLFLRNRDEVAFLQNSVTIALPKNEAFFAEIFTWNITYIIFQQRVQTRHDSKFPMHSHG